MISHKDVMGKIPPQRHARIQERTDKALQEIRALREIREKLGLTQEELAQKLGVQQPAVSKLEREGRNLTLGTLSNIITSLGGTWEIRVYVPDLGDIRLAGSDDFEAIGSESAHKRA